MVSAVFSNISWLKSILLIWPCPNLKRSNSAIPDDPKNHPERRVNPDNTCVIGVFSYPSDIVELLRNLFVDKLLAKFCHSEFLRRKSMREQFLGPRHPPYRCYWIVFCATTRDDRVFMVGNDFSNRRLLRMCRGAWQWCAQWAMVDKRVRVRIDIIHDP